MISRRWQRTRARPSTRRRPSGTRCGASATPRRVSSTCSATTRTPAALEDVPINERIASPDDEARDRRPRVLPPSPARRTTRSRRSVATRSTPSPRRGLAASTTRSCPRPGSSRSTTSTSRRTASRATSTTRPTTSRTTRRRRGCLRHADAPSARGARALDVGTGQRYARAPRGARTRTTSSRPTSTLAPWSSPRLNAGAQRADEHRDTAGQPLRAGRRRAFDLITCNAPYVVSPERRWIYRDAGFEAGRALGAHRRARRLATSPRTGSRR